MPTPDPPARSPVVADPGSAARSAPCVLGSPRILNGTLIRVFRAATVPMFAAGEVPVPGIMWTVLQPDSGGDGAMWCWHEAGGEANPLGPGSGAAADLSWRATGHGNE